MSVSQAVEFLSSTSPLLRAHIFGLTQYAQQLNALLHSVEFVKGQSKLAADALAQVEELRRELRRSAESVLTATLEQRVALRTRVGALKSALGAAKSAAAADVSETLVRNALREQHRQFNKLIDFQIPSLLRNESSVSHLAESYASIDRKLLELTQIITSEKAGAPIGFGELAHHSSYNPGNYAVHSGDIKRVTSCVGAREPMTPNTRFFGAPHSVHGPPRPQLVEQNDLVSRCAIRSNSSAIMTPHRSGSVYFDECRNQSAIPSNAFEPPSAFATDDFAFRPPADGILPRAGFEATLAPAAARRWSDNPAHATLARDPASDYAAPPRAAQTPPLAAPASPIGGFDAHQTDDEFNATAFPGSGAPGAAAFASRQPSNAFEPPDSARRRPRFSLKRSNSSKPFQF